MSSPPPSRHTNESSVSVNLTQLFLSARSLARPSGSVVTHSLPCFTHVLIVSLSQALQVVSRNSQDRLGLLPVSESNKGVQWLELFDNSKTPSSFESKSFSVFDRSFKLNISTFHCLHCQYNQYSWALFFSASHGLAWFAELRIGKSKLWYQAITPVFPAGRLLGCAGTLCLYPVIDSITFYDYGFLILSGGWLWHYQLGDEFPSNATLLTTQKNNVRKLWYDPLYERVLYLSLPGLEVFIMKNDGDFPVLEYLNSLPSMLPGLSSKDLKNLVDIHSFREQLYVSMVCCVDVPNGSRLILILNSFEQKDYVVVYSIVWGIYRRTTSIPFNLRYDSVLVEPYTNRTMFFWHDFLIYGPRNTSIEKLDRSQLRVSLVVELFNCKNYYWQSSSTRAIGLSSIDKYRKHVHALGRNTYGKDFVDIKFRSFDVATDLKAPSRWLLVLWILSGLVLLCLVIFLALWCYRKRRWIKYYCRKLYLYCGTGSSTLSYLKGGEESNIEDTTKKATTLPPSISTSHSKKRSRHKPNSLGKFSISTTKTF